MSDGARPAAELDPAQRALSGNPLVLYDGWCNLCDSSVAFILRRDRRAVFRFAALQSAAAGRLLAACGEGQRLDQTLVLVYRGRCQTKSDAVLTTLGLLPAPWPVLRALRILPRSLRDWTYDQVARHRTRWFGRTKVCMTSLAGFRDRFLEG